MTTARKHQKRVGEASFAATSPTTSPNTRPNTSPISFPADKVLTRVIVERPTNPPVRRTCPYCKAIFDDYSRKWNTTYCRASCRNRMSLLKKATAVKLLTSLTESEAVEKLLGFGGLAAIERALNAFGYSWDVEQKDWIK